MNEKKKNRRVVRGNGRGEKMEKERREEEGIRWRSLRDETSNIGE